MKNQFLCFLGRCMLFTASLTLHMGIASAASSVRLSGHVPAKAVADAVLLKHVDAATHVPVTFVLPLRNQDVLEKLIQRIYDPTDQQYYGKYLTSQEFIELFAPTQEDYDQVIAYAENLGLTVTGHHSNRTLLNVAGTAESIETAFNLHLHHYRKPNGQEFYAPNNDPEVPHSLAGVIHGIVGLDNHVVRRSYHRQKQSAHEHDVTAEKSLSGPGGGYTPKDLLTAYNLTGIGANGAGQAIALFELGGYNTTDIYEYTNQFGLPAPKLQNVLVNGGSTSGIDPEVTLDIELALALAPESQIYVYEGPNSNQGVLNTYNRIATDNIAKQVSTSWGMGENLVDAQYLQAEHAIFLQMAAHGQTIYAAAGDSGAYDDYACNSSTALVVDDPASQPYVVGVGGTRLKVHPGNGAYDSEQVWDDGLGKGAGGGGVSTVWPIPAWQKTLSTVYSTTHRNVPDVALNADPETGYAIYYDGNWTIYGGTSCAAPLWAAFTACVNQARVSHQKPVLGFANPLLYALGTGSLYSTDFHDITLGNNLYYSAKTGYDNATGWGSFNGANLFASLTNVAPASQPSQPSSLLNIAMKHITPFVRGEIGTYCIEVSNQGNDATAGPVAVAITIPNSLGCMSLSGSGWTVDNNTLTCTRNDALASGSSYPLITLRVYVRDYTPHVVIGTATVSGGGCPTSTVTSSTTLSDSFCEL